MRFYSDLCVPIKSRFSFEKRSDPNGIRTRVTAVKGRCPRPLDDRVSERQISRRRPALQVAFLSNGRNGKSQEIPIPNR